MSAVPSPADLGLSPADAAYFRQPAIRRVAHAVPVLGAAYVAFAQVVPARLDLALGGTATCGALALLALRTPGAAVPRRFALLGGAAGAFLLFAGRDSEVLAALHVLAALLLLLFQTPLALELPLRAVGALRLVLITLASGLQAAVAPLLLAIGVSPAIRGTPRTRLRAAVIGLLVAAPALLLFAALLASADPVFAGLLERLEPLSAARRWIGWSVLASFVLTSALVAPLPALAALTRREPPALLAPGSGAVALGLVALLLAGFLGTNAGVLLGGEAALRAAGVSHAEWARRGFFELVWVTALALPFCWMVTGATAPATRRARLAVHGLAALLLAELVLLLASAAWRMGRYVHAFGLSEDRFLTLAIMAWLAPLLVWAGVTLLAARRERFVPGVIGWSLAMVLALDVANPDARVVTWNVTHRPAERALDVAYLATLSADAAPALADVAPLLTPAERVVARTLTGCATARRRWTAGQAGCVRLGGL